jgi:hypothetical protein
LADRDPPGKPLVPQQSKRNRIEETEMKPETTRDIMSVSDMKKLVSKPAKAQRIKMRLHKHPVKVDGTITHFAPDGESFTVEFDGPIPTTMFYVWSENLVLDKPPKKHGDGRVSHPEGTYQFWEVL